MTDLQSSHPPTSPVAPAAGFHVWIINWLLGAALLLFAGWGAFREIRDNAESSYAIGRAAGRFIGTAIVIAIVFGVGWAVYRLGRRSNLAGNMVFLVLLILIALARLVQSSPT